MSAKFSASRSLSAREMAARWFALQEGGRLTPEQRAQLQRWLEEPRHAEAYEEARRAWAVFDGAPKDDPHLQALRRAALAAAPERGVLRAMVASTVLLLAAALLWTAWHFGPAYLLRANLRAHATSTAPGGDPVRSSHYATGAHERLDVRLPDGTLVALNAATTVDVAYSGTERLITLSRGQAFFEVAHDAAHPFVVQTPHRRVTALGTQFEVEAASGLFQVTLVEGSVRVDNEPDALASLSAPPTQVVLTPGQALVARLGIEERVIKVDVERRLRWRQGFIEFDNEPLGEAVAEIARYFPEPVVVRDPRVAQLRVSGLFRTTANDEFLSIIKELLPVDVRRRADGSAEIVWREVPATR